MQLNPISLVLAGTKKNINSSQDQDQYTSNIQISVFQFRENKLCLFSSENANSVSKETNSLHWIKEGGPTRDLSIAVSCRLY